MVSSLIPLSFDDNGAPDEMNEMRGTAICMSVPWLSFVGDSLRSSLLSSARRGVSISSFKLDGMLFATL